MGVLNMRFLVTLAIVTLAYAKPGVGPDGKLVGGEEAPEHEFPWQISLKDVGSHICGSSINEKQVITAAHCVEGKLPILDSVVAGAHKRIGEFGHQKRKIATMEAHADHNNPRFNNDVAIITLTEPFDFTDPNVQPIGMFMSEDAEIPTDTICNATGWGILYGSPFATLPNELQWIQLPVLSHEECETVHTPYITDGMVCAGSKDHTTCSGDSGGPLVCPDAEGIAKLAGIVSFGHSECPDSAVFTKVAFYEEWIQARIVQ